MKPMFCIRKNLLFCFLKYFVLVNKPDSSFESTFACSVLLITHCPTPSSVVKPLMIPQCPHTHTHTDTHTHTHTHRHTHTHAQTHTHIFTHTHTHPHAHTHTHSPHTHTHTPTHTHTHTHTHTFTLSALLIYF